MKIFISNKFQNEDKREIRKKLEKIIFCLENAGHKIFNIFRDLNWEKRELLPGRTISLAFDKIKKCDAILVLLDNKMKSEGIYLEIGFAKALNKKIILLIFDKLSFPTLEALSDLVIKFSDWENIDRSLNKIE